MAIMELTFNLFLNFNETITLKHHNKQPFSTPKLFFYKQSLYNSPDLNTYCNFPLKPFQSHKQLNNPFYSLYLPPLNLLENCSVVIALFLNCFCLPWLYHLLTMVVDKVHRRWCFRCLIDKLILLVV